MSTRTAQSKHLLMCRPEFYTVCYRINPWMHPAKPTSTAKAINQWETLYRTYLDLGYSVELIDPIDGLPDMVYAANGGLVIDGKALGARFRYKERSPEGPAYMTRLHELGFDVTPPIAFNEGEGDFLKVGDLILGGSGFRSAIASHHEVADAFGKEVVTLELINPNYYHLDTCLAVIDDTNIAYLPSAFSETSLSILRQRFPEAIIASEEDAAVFGLNLVSDGRRVVMAQQATGLANQLTAYGYEPLGVDVSELNLGGGGIKCCTLELRH
jgi:N-dimethylarginine dimethylaminohydrolase